MTVLISEPESRGPFAEQARALHALGWPVIPVGWPGEPLSKDPPYSGITGHGGVDLDDAGVEVAIGTHGGCNIAVRVPPGVVGIDVDDYVKTKIRKDGTTELIIKRGLSSLAELEERHGPLPLTVMTTAREGLSGIRWFRLPAGHKDACFPGELTGDIEVIQRHHRYGMTVGSVNPETGTVYQARDSMTAAVRPMCGPDDLPELPVKWCEDLRVAPAKIGRTGKVPPKYSLGWGKSLPRDLDPCRAMQTVLDRWLDQLRAAPAGHADHGRHPSMRSAARALVGMHADGHLGVYVALQAICDEYLARMDGERRNAEYEFARAVDSAVYKFESDGTGTDCRCRDGAGAASLGHFWTEEYGRGWVDEEGADWDPPEVVAGEPLDWSAMLDALGIVDPDAELPGLPDPPVAFAPEPASEPVPPAGVSAPAPAPAPAAPDPYGYVPFADPDWWTEPDPVFVVPRMVREGDSVVIYCGAGKGKSLLAQDAAIGLAVAGRVFGIDVERVPLLYVDHENAASELRRRARGFGFGPGADWSLLHYSLLGYWQPLDTRSGGTQLLGEALRVGARVVVLDTVSKTTEGEENSNDTYAKLHKHTLAPLKKAGIAALILDHTGKDETRGTRGGSAKLQNVDEQFLLSATTGGEFVTLHREKNRTGAYPERIDFRRDAGTGLHEFVGALPAAAAKSMELEDAALAVVAMLDDGGVDKTWGRPKVRGWLSVAYPDLKFTNVVLEMAVKIRKAAE